MSRNMHFALNSNLSFITWAYTGHPNSCRLEQSTVIIHTFFKFQQYVVVDGDMLLMWPTKFATTTKKSRDKLAFESKNLIFSSNVLFIHFETPIWCGVPDKVRCLQYHDLYKIHQRECNYQSIQLNINPYYYYGLSYRAYYIVCTCFLIKKEYMLFEL